MTARNEDDRSFYQSLPSSSKVSRPLSPDSLDADIEPSSSEHEDNEEEDTSNEQPFKELQDSSEKPAMSNKRRLCLVGSLLLCVFTVFAFAFILPCHHKTCLKETKWPNWSKNFTGVSPLILRDFDTQNTSSKNIIVGFSHEGRGFHVLNHTCPGCHGGVVAVDGSNGEQLWASGIFGQLGNVLCDLNVKQQNQPSCIALEDNDKVFRIDSHNGYQQWTVHRPGTIKAFRTIRDIDNDGIGEIVLLHASPQHDSELCVLSGKTGKDIGVTLPILKRRTLLGLHHDGFLRVHHLSSSKQVLLIGVKLDSQETGTLLAIHIDELDTRVHNKTTRGLRWGRRMPDEEGFIKLFDSLVLTRPLFADLNHDGVDDIVICTLEAGLTVKAINGKDTTVLWSRKLTSMGIHKSVPTIVSLGVKVTDIAIMIQLNNQSTRIVVLNGKNGLALWMFTLKNPLTVPPVGVPKRAHIPRGLLLWLPQVRIRQHLSKRETGYLTDFKTRRIGLRKRRETKDNKETPPDSLSIGLEKHKALTNDKTKADGKNADKDAGDFINSILQLRRKDSQTDYLDIDGSKAKADKNDDITSKHTADDVERVDDDDDDDDDDEGGDDDHQNGENHDVDGVYHNFYKKRSKDMKHVDGYGKHDDDDDDDDDDDIDRDDDYDDEDVTDNNNVMAHRRPITEQNLSELRNLLLNLENRLRRETRREMKPSPTQTVSPTPQDTNENRTGERSTSTQPRTEQDKPLNCDLPADKVNRDISAVLIYRDTKHQLQLMEIAREKVINIAPEEFVNKFGEQPPIAYSCIQLIPTITTRPLVTDIDGDNRPDLVYTVHYTTLNKPSTARKSYMMKLRKVDILDAIDDKKNQKVLTKLYKSEKKKNYKRNEKFDLPFLRWN